MLTENMSAFHDTLAGSFTMGAFMNPATIIPAMQITYTVYRKNRESQDYLNSL